MIGPLIDVFRLRQYFDAITVARELAAGVFDDAGFLFDVRRALLPLPFEGRGPARTTGSPFPPAQVRRLDGLEGRRVAIATTGGSGALASLVGVARAFEERGITPAAISACSGAALFAYPLGTGTSAHEVASFVLSLRSRDYIDLDVAGLAKLPLDAGRGFSGILKGEAVEAAYRNRFGDVRLGDLPIPVYAPLWEVDHNRVLHIGPETHPDLPLARAVRMSIALPLFFQAVQLDGSWCCDGGVVDIFPVKPILERVAPDAVVAVNGFYPPGFVGEDVTGWHDRSMSILSAASQVRTSQQAALARENLARLKRACAVELIEPVPYEKVQGAGFYRQFIDNSEWASFMHEGRLAGLEALAALARTSGQPWGQPSGRASGRAGHHAEPGRAG
ncbi:MAG TPA: patatin-like phospholipase family protein [Nocardioidaceae bacterium]|nr:patatin-like phospholipase family protein [Nocardioidaceae bacterium]